MGSYLSAFESDQIEQAFLDYVTAIHGRLGALEVLGGLPWGS
jgi:hypothetical protein